MKSELHGIPRDLVGAYLHFRQRYRERVFSDIPPRLFWDTARTEIGETGMMTAHPTFHACMRICRQRQRRLWRTTIDGAPLFIVYDHKSNCPVTVLSVPGKVATERGIMDLEMWV